MVNLNLNKEILNQVTDGIVICTPDEKVYFYNDAAKKMVGDLVHGVTEVHGPKQDVLKYKGDGVTLFNQDELPMIRALNGVTCQDLEMLIVYQNHSSEPIWTSINSFPIKDDKGKIIAGFISIRDLSERRKSLYEFQLLNGKLANLNEALKVKNQELKDFAARVAHDLKAPLAPIKGFVEMAKVDLADNLDEYQMTILDKILKSANSMSQLITELLNYATLEGSEYSPEEVDLNEIIKEISELSGSSLTQRNGKLKVENLPKVNCQQAPVKQLFNNIISNSIKYSQDDIPLIIEVSTSKNSEYQTIKIKDNGIGFKEEDEKVIFEPMARLRTSKAKGHGLGLAISAKAAEKEGWTISAKGELGVGAEFTISIPVSKII